MEQGVQEVDLFLALRRMSSGAPATPRAEWNGPTQSFLVRCGQQARKVLASSLSKILARPFDVSVEVWSISQEEALAVIAASTSFDVD